MATAATLSPNGGTSGGTAQTTAGKGQPTPVVIVKPFTRASNEHRESIGFDKTLALTASDQDLGSVAIPAYGYLRSILLVITASGGGGTAPGVLAANGPFNVLKNIVVQEPNGATIAQFNQGYNLFLANKYGGYRGYNDPRSSPSFSSVPGAFTFVVRIPLEVNARSSLASLPNQNSAAAFQLRATLAGSGEVYSTQPTTLPNVRIRAYAEEWDQPAPSSDGSANATTPPAMNTTQYWSEQTYPVSAGQNTIRLTRVGNFIRNLHFVYKDNTGARAAAANWPDVVQLFLDTRPLDTVQNLQWQQTTFERYGYGESVGATTPALDTAKGLDTGVWPYDFCHEFSGRVGFELNDNWLPTLSSTRLEVQGNFGVAGTLTVVTNDIAPAGNVFLNG